MNRIFARYEVETAFSLDEAIGVMAGEQSSGTFLAVPGETAELKERSGGASSGSGRRARWRGLRCRGRECRNRLERPFGGGRKR